MIGNIQSKKSKIGREKAWNKQGEPFVKLLKPKFPKLSHLRIQFKQKVIDERFNNQIP
jgi:hypothetical protein